MTPRSYASTAVILIVVALLVSAVAHAQPSVATGWSTPFEVADLPGTTGGSLVTGDSAGNVYLVWFANSQGKGEDQADTVYFRQWNGTEWSPSVDILAATPDGPWLRVDQLVLDAYGQLALLWHQDRRLVMSVAESTEAGRAPGWTSIPLPIDELTYKSDLLAGPDGALHVLVTGEGQNVYYLRSDDIGETWSTVQVSAGDDIARQYSWGSLALDPVNPGTLYASWTESREDEDWTVTGVFASRSTDNGATWSEPIPLINARGHGHSTITALAGAGEDVMTVWNRAVGSVDGRYFALSNDGGETWEEPQVAYEKVSGLTRPPYLFTDSLGELHMIGAGFDALTPVGGEQIWHSQWDSSRWSEPNPIVVAGKPMTGNEVFDARLVGGNRLLFTWTDAATKDIWVTSQTLVGPELPDGRLELPTDVAPTAVSWEAEIPDAATPSSTPILLTREQSGQQPSDPLTPLAVSVLPAMLLVILVVIIGIRRR
jgi:hypothetical protein